MLNKPIKCWNCKTDMDSQMLFCVQCDSVQPPAPINHFMRLGLQCEFELGSKNIDVAYFALQRKLHPDIFVNKSEKEQALSLQQTVAINESYEILRRPLARAEYMLSLEGVVVNSDDATVKPSQELLAESLQSREQLANIKTEQELRKLSINVAEEQLKCIEEIKDSIKQKDLGPAAQHTIRLRYLEKLIEEISQKKIS